MSCRRATLHFHGSTQPLRASWEATVARQESGQQQQRQQLRSRRRPLSTSPPDARFCGRRWWGFNPSVQTFHGRVHLYTRRFNKGGHGAEPAVLWQHASEFQLDEHFQLCVLCIPSYLGARRGRCLAAVR
jgi:hypothetical protein